MKKWVISFLCLLLLGLAGCTSVSAVNMSKVDLRRFQHVHVIRSGNDSDHLDQLLANELTRQGFQASAGVRTMMPEETELVLDYTAGWNWEIRKYLMSLEVNVRAADSRQLLASGRIVHPGVTNKSPEKMIAEVVERLLEPQ